MLLIIHTLAFFGAMALFAAAVAWWKVVRFPTSGPKAESAELDIQRVETAARVTAIAFGLCAAGALMAIAEWFLR